MSDDWRERWKKNVTPQELKLINKIEKYKNIRDEANADYLNAEKAYSDYKASEYEAALVEYPQKSLKKGDSFYNIFQGKSEVNRMLLSYIGDSKFISNEIYGILVRLGVYTVLDVVSRPREFYAQPSILGEDNTQNLENVINSYGLDFGMQFTAFGFHP